MITNRGNAPSSCVLLILDPVTTTFSRVTTSPSASELVVSTSSSATTSSSVLSTACDSLDSVELASVSSPGLSATTLKANINKNVNNKLL